MTEQEFITSATDLTKQIVDAIADKEYAKLATLAQRKRLLRHSGNGWTDNWQCGRRTKNELLLLTILTNRVWKKSYWRRTTRPLRHIIRQMQGKNWIFGLNCNIG